MQILGDLSAGLQRGAEKLSFSCASDNSATPAASEEAGSAASGGRQGCALPHTWRLPSLRPPSSRRARAALAVLSRRFQVALGWERHSPVVFWTRPPPLLRQDSFILRDKVVMSRRPMRRDPGGFQSVGAGFVSGGSVSAGTVRTFINEAQAVVTPEKGLRATPLVHWPGLPASLQLSGP